MTAAAHVAEKQPTGINKVESDGHSCSFIDFVPMRFSSLPCSPEKKYWTLHLSVQGRIQGVSCPSS